jgi:hypothetical protein
VPSANVVLVFVNMLVSWFAFMFGLANPLYMTLFYYLSIFTNYIDDC